MGWKFNFGRPYKITGKKHDTVAEHDKCENPDGKKNNRRAKRWGKPFKDRRNWVKYNEELVVRGEFILELDWVRLWDNELKTMNNGKRGSPYVFPESLIRLQAVWHQWIDYRGIEGITRKLQEHGLVPEYNDYSTINRRVNKTDVSIELPRKGKVNVSFDGTGAKMTNRGEYKANRYGEETKKYVSIKIAADPINKKLLACDVSISDGGLSEPKTAEKQMKGIMANGLKINKAWGDGSYDTHDLFNLCERNDIKTAIKIRKDASSKSGGSMRRAREVKEYKEKGYKKWAKDKKYGRRWTGTEGIFSAVKRKFSENIRSRNKPNICHEAKSKFWAYDRMKSYAEAGVM